MAGEWIKVRTNLWDDPRVSQLCDITGAAESSIIGGLYWLWAAADEHTETGLMTGLSVSAVDRKTGIKGFGAALVSIAWVEETPEGIQIIRFGEHNGESAKARAQTAKRVANHKANAKVTPPPLPEQHSGVTDALPREDKNKRKNKELKSKATTSPAAFDPIPDLTKEGVLEQTAADWLSMRKAKRAPVTATVLRNIILEVGKAGMSMDAALTLACSRGWVGFQAEWVLRDQRAGPATPYQTANDKARAWGDELTGRTTNHEHGRTITDINEPPAGFLDFRDFAQDAP
jgi:hypothetical protein